MIWQARRDSNPQHPDLESDALPLELLACIIILFGLFMQSMFSAKSTILAEFQLIRCCTFIFRCRIISSFAFSTCKGNDCSHDQTPSPLFNDFTYHSGADSPTAFPYRKPQLLLHSYRCYQLSRNGYIVSRHNHLYTLRQT